jgi:hypothetical protein
MFKSTDEAKSADETKPSGNLAAAELLLRNCCLDTEANLTAIRSSDVYQLNIARSLFFLSRLDMACVDSFLFDDLLTTEHRALVCLVPQYAIEAAKIICILDQNKLLDIANRTALTDYIHMADFIFQELEKKSSLDQKSFDSIIQDCYKKTITTFCSGLHSRLGGDSFIWRCFGHTEGKPNDSLGEVAVLKTIFSFIKPQS